LQLRQHGAHVLDARRHHERATARFGLVDLPARGEHGVVQDHVVQLVDHLPFHLVADHLVDLASVGEGQIQHPHGQHVTGQGNVRRGPAGHARRTLLQSLLLPFGERALVLGDLLLEGGHRAAVPEAGFEDGELHRPRAEIDSSDCVGHGPSIPLANTG